jgi:hypothetical protein
MRHIPRTYIEAGTPYVDVRALYRSGKILPGTSMLAVRTPAGTMNVQVLWKAEPLGGESPRLQCPRCGRGRYHLHLDGEVLGCRGRGGGCLENVAYASRHILQGDPLRHAVRLRRLMGANPQPFGPLPPRPPRGRAAAAWDRVVRQIIRAENAASASIEKEAARVRRKGQGGADHPARRRDV